MIISLLGTVLTHLSSWQLQGHYLIIFDPQQKILIRNYFERLSRVQKYLLE